MQKIRKTLRDVSQKTVLPTNQPTNQPVTTDFGLIWRPFREYLQIKNFFQKSSCDFSTL